MTRTTLDLDSSVLAQLRQQARVEGKSMGRVASEQLAAGLRATPQAQLTPITWPRSHMGVPKVDLSDKEAVRKALDASAVDRAR